MQAVPGSCATREATACHERAAGGEWRGSRNGRSDAGDNAFIERDKAPARARGDAGDSRGTGAAVRRGHGARRPGSRDSARGLRRNRRRRPGHVRRRLRAAGRPGAAEPGALGGLPAGAVARRCVGGDGDPGSRLGAAELSAGGEPVRAGGSRRHFRVSFDDGVAATDSESALVRGSRRGRRRSAWGRSVIGDLRRRRARENGAVRRRSVTTTTPAAGASLSAGICFAPSSRPRAVPLRGRRAARGFALLSCCTAIARAVRPGALPAATLVAGTSHLLASFRAALPGRKYFEAPARRARNTLEDRANTLPQLLYAADGLSAAVTGGEGRSRVR
jgi:hypothetical protein